VSVGGRARLDRRRRQFGYLAERPTRPPTARRFAIFKFGPLVLAAVELVIEVVALMTWRWWA
jgi:hypothetical protein